MSRIVIFANGELPSLESARSILQEGDYLIAADGGARHLLAMGILPNVLIGDLDSVDEDMLFELTSAEVDIKQFSEDKNETDLELAVQYAVELQATSILIVGALGGRLDQTLASIVLLTDPELARLNLSLDDGVEEACICREHVKIQGRSGDIVSLIPWGGSVESVVTEGLQWPLHGEVLFSSKTRGISNVMLADTATVKIGSGLLLIVHRRKA